MRPFWSTSFISFLPPSPVNVLGCTCKMSQTHGGNMHGVVVIINEYKTIGGKITKHVPTIPSTSNNLIITTSKKNTQHYLFLQDSICPLEQRWWLEQWRVQISTWRTKNRTNVETFQMYYMSLQQWPFSWQILVTLFFLNGILLAYIQSDPGSPEFHHKVMIVLLTGKRPTAIYSVQWQFSHKDSTTKSESETDELTWPGGCRTPPLMYASTSRIYSSTQMKQRGGTHAVILPVTTLCVYALFHAALGLPSFLPTADCMCVYSQR